MKIKELAEKLQQKFIDGQECGIVKVDHRDWQNIYFVVPPPPPKTLTDKLDYGLVGEALKILNGLPQFSEMSELDMLINYLFVRREAVQSSRLEGTWSTIDHALTPGEISDSGESKNEHQAVRCYANLFEGILKKATEEKAEIFTEEFVCSVQKRIVENDPNSSGVPGKLRTPNEPGSIVTIGGGQRSENSIYNPAPASEVRRCLNDVLEWFRDDEMAQMGDAGAGGLSLPIRLAIGHSHFEAIHPFTDGNGRTGRTLWPIQMISAGNMPLYLSGYVEAKKEKYGAALAESQKRLNYGPIIEFICNAIIESNLETKKTKETIKSLEDRWQERGRFREKSASKRALRLLLTSPIITNAFLQKELGVSKTASNEAIKTLEERKVIRYRKLEKRQKVYAAEELIQVLSRPFGSEVELALEKAEILLELKS
ncbi:MAG: Fic family protein [Bacteriovoracaceae bacterium]|jgi:Fic family protein|nr:Fic family protein [Bacteriovoracaceae bacterium]